MKLVLIFLNKFSKKNFLIFFLLGIFNSFIEILGISLLLPIFDILLNNEINPKFYVLINFLGIESLKTDYLLITIVLA